MVWQEIQRPDCHAAGRFSSASEVGMLSPTELGRRITSAQDRLRAARRDGRFDDIVIWRDELDSLARAVPENQGSTVTVFVVTGPPAGGKSTWVRKHAKPADITIDYDDLVNVLSPGLPSDPVDQPPHCIAVAQAARSAAINDATMDADAQGQNSRYDVYLVHAMPDRHAMNRYRKYGFEIVTIEPGFDECMRRAMLERTPRQQAIVHDWYVRRGLAV